jgi:hypothetical protein
LLRRYMRPKAILLFLVISTALLGQGAYTLPAKDHNDWLATQLKTIESIKPGMTRSDVLKVLLYAGGLSSIRERFNPKTSPYITVEIEFRRTADRSHHMEDFVLTVSRPYLERPVYD